MILAQIFFSPLTRGRFAVHYDYARASRKMSRLEGALYACLAVLMHVFLRLESPAWQLFRKRWGPWFQHLRTQPYRRSDPLRYVLQALWLLLVRGNPAPRKTAIGRKLSLSIDRIRLWRSRTIAWLATLPNKARSTDSFRATRTVLRSLNRRRRIVMFATLCAVALPLFALLVTQPFDVVAQAVFVAILWVMALVVRRLPSHFSTLMLMVLSVTVSGRYLWWRYTSTLNLDSPLDSAFGIGLLAAETYSWCVLLLGYVQCALPLRRTPAALPPSPREWPTVDVMIPTYNEDLSVVKPTVYAALGLDWPKDKLRIHLLDDGHRAEFREFASEAGVNYVVRADNRHAKAGNLNHALQITDGDLVAIFDCDHIPTRSFLQVTVGWFLRDPKMALVQTPHHFFSPDPFERNLGQFKQHPNENTLFYGLVQDGNDLWNAAFFCGSCAVLRRTALEEIGGIAVETVTEDAHTALRLHRRGYNSAYLRIPQAAGLATESLSAHIGQRIRWARGMVQIFRTDNPLFGRGLSVFQRLCYTNAMLHFMAGLPRLVYLTAPLAFLLFHAYIIYAPAWAILLYVIPHMAHATLTNSHMQGSYRRTFWGEIYETVLAWYIARPTTVALFAPSKGKFNVTAKGGLVERDYFDWTISHPYVLLALANIVGFLVGIWRLFTGPDHEVLTVLITMAWVTYNLVILGGALAVAAEVRQVRKAHRIETRLPATLQFESGHALPTVVRDFSDGGAAVELPPGRYLKDNESVRLILSRGDRHYSFPAKVARHFPTGAGLRFDHLSASQQTELVQCTFARADSWLIGAQRYEPDAPLSSLRNIAAISYRGYAEMGRNLPFPLSVLPKSLTASTSWLASLLPVTRLRSAEQP